MKAVKEDKDKVYEIFQDANGKWFGYCDQTKEYTPAFLKLKNLIKLLEMKGYKTEELVDGTE